MAPLPRRRKPSSANKAPRFARFRRVPRSDAPGARPRRGIYLLPNAFTTAAAALVVGLVMFMSDPTIAIDARKVDWISWGIALFAGLTMVTNVPFYSFKDVNFRKSVPFIAVFLIALGLALLAIAPELILW